MGADQPNTATDECMEEVWKLILNYRREIHLLRPAQINVILVCLKHGRQNFQSSFLCLFQVGITEPSYDEVAACQASVEGQNILHDFGVETLALEPAYTWVPWVTVNGVR